MSAGQGKFKNMTFWHLRGHAASEKCQATYAPCFLKATSSMNSNYIENHHGYAFFWYFVGKVSEVYTLSFAFSEEVHSLLLKATERWNPDCDIHRIIGQTHGRSSWMFCTSISFQKGSKKPKTGAFSNPPLFVVWGFMPSAAKILYLEKCEGFKEKLGGFMQGEMSFVLIQTGTQHYPTARGVPT